MADRLKSDIHMFPRLPVQLIQFSASNYSDTGIRLCIDRQRCRCADQLSIVRDLFRPAAVLPKIPASILIIAGVTQSIRKDSKEEKKRRKLFKCVGGWLI